MVYEQQEYIAKEIFCHLYFVLCVCVLMLLLVAIALIFSFLTNPPSTHDGHSLNTNLSLLVNRIYILFLEKLFRIL